jgi:putative ABC transport system permease protein
MGLATCLLIFLYVLDELSFDKYNVNADRIYRVNNEIKFGDNYFDLAATPALLGTTMLSEFPQVENYTRIRWYGSFRVRKGNENIKEERVGYGDSTLFQVFTLPMLAGDPNTALKGKHSLVITEKIAKKYFPNESSRGSTDIVGKSMLINDTGNYRITAVIKDVPEQSHFNFNIFLPLIDDAGSTNDIWLSENYNTYILLKKNANAKNLESQLNAMMDRHVGPQLKSIVNLSMDEFHKSGGFARASLTPLTQIHLHSNKVAELDGNGNAQLVYIFTAIAVLILLIACVNFMNLSTARSANRAKEVGVRKVLGSQRKDLVQQFLTESSLIALVALVLAVLAAWLLLPYFNQLTGKTIHASTLFQLRMLLSIVTLVIVVGVAAGSYPAFFLSSFQPIEVLKGKLAKGFKRSHLRNGFVVFQFVISVLLIFGTIVIYRQLNYIHQRDIGFDRNQVLVIQHSSALGEQATSFRNELLQISGVKDATMSGFLPVNFNRNSDAYFTSPALDQKTAIVLQNWPVDEHYVPTLGIKMIDGRNFSSQFPTDSTAIIINEAAAKFLATKEILNKKLYNFKDINTKALNEFHIIGVFKNFNFSSLRDVITPLALVFSKDDGNISVRVASANLPNTLNQIKNKWKAIAPAQPFDYTFMDEDFNKLYTSESRTGKLFITFAIFAIIIACLGLFGLVTYAAEQRVREIGIRKVLGANLLNIIAMISMDFLKLVCIASVIGFPLAWWASHKWLQDYAYRIGIEWWMFVMTGLMALFIAFATVSFQAVKAALANPVKSLRTE